MRFPRTLPARRRVDDGVVGAGLFDDRVDDWLVAEGSKRALGRKRAVAPWCGQDRNGTGYRDDSDDRHQKCRPPDSAARFTERRKCGARPGGGHYPVPVAAAAVVGRDDPIERFLNLVYRHATSLSPSRLAFTAARAGVNEAATVPGRTPMTRPISR